ncbi:MAG: hypothetical protein IJZ81_04335 [Clostridia bacterium]|nr:hypothetical protein [Clostridia bacterium]
MNNGTDILFEVLGICLVLFFIIVLFVKYIANVYMPFVDDRDYIRMEIMRSHGSERIHWQHELTRLYLGKIPFVGKHMAKNYMRRRK